MLDDRNKLERLEAKVKELEKKVRELPKKQEVISDLKNRLSHYEDEIRSDNGNVILKKNFVIKNRKGAAIDKDAGIIDPNRDNTVTMFFNDKREGRINNLFIGSNSALGDFNSQTISIDVIKKDDIGSVDVPVTPAQKEFFNYDSNTIKTENPNNGRIQAILYREKDLDERGVPVAPRTPNLIVSDVASTPSAVLFEKGKDNVDGVGAQISGQGVDGFASIAHLDDAMNITASFGCGNGMYNINPAALPTADPNTQGQLWRDGTTLKISLG